MSESIQEQKSSSRFRLTPQQPAAKSLPVGAPVDGSRLADAADGPRLTPQIAGDIGFGTEISFGNLGSLRLRTTGFEEFESSDTEIEIAPHVHGPA